MNERQKQWSNRPKSEGQGEKGMGGRDRGMRVGKVMGERQGRRGHV